MLLGTLQKDITTTFCWSSILQRWLKLSWLSLSSLLSYLSPSSSLSGLSLFSSGITFYASIKTSIVNFLNTFFYFCRHYGKMSRGGNRFNERALEDIIQVMIGKAYRTDTKKDYYNYKC